MSNLVSRTAPIGWLVDEAHRTTGSYRFSIYFYRSLECQPTPRWWVPPSRWCSRSRRVRGRCRREDPSVSSAPGRVAHRRNQVQIVRLLPVRLGHYEPGLERLIELKADLLRVHC